MRATEFTAATPGRIVRSLDGHDAFAPDLLPPIGPINLASLQAALSDAANALGRLDGLASWLPDPQILVRPFIRREAVLSSNIEDTFAEFEELARYAIDASVGRRNADVHEVANAERTITFGLEAVLVRGRSISLGLIREMHAMLLEGVRGAENVRGAFRQRQVFIGRHALGIEGARFVPPPFHLVPELMERLEAFVAAGPRDAHPILHAALTHYQFETIHPFEDGNGRLGRVLILLQLCRAGLLRVPALNPSLHFEVNRGEYYDALLAVSMRGEWDRWLLFFTDGITRAARDAIDRLDRIRTLQSAYRQRLHSARTSSTLLKLVDELFTLPELTIVDAQRLLGLSYPSAKSNVERLVDAGILTERLPTRTPRLFAAREILDVLRVERSRS